MATVLITAVTFVFGLVAVAYLPYHMRPSPIWAGQGANVREEVRTAHWHSYGGYDARALSYVQLHMGHALNCLEGTKGKNFNKSWGNECEGQGNGILADLKDEPGGARFMILARAADALAVEGVNSKDLAEAGRAGRGVAALL